MIQTININVSLDYDDSEITRAIKKKYNINISDYKLITRSLDARKDELKFNLKLAIDYPKKLKVSGAMPKEYELPKKKCDANIAIVGAGPAGLFAAHVLSACGAKITIYERGSKVEDRVRDVEDFIRSRKLNPDSNISFGEGGAGTFSDGKLTSRSKDARKEYIKEILFKYGADSEITIMHKPHIGTDILRNIIIKLREDLKNRGVSINFNTRVDNILIENGKARGVVISDKTFFHDKIILALGNAARDTFLNLIDEKLDIIPKPYAVGFRIEHLQSYVDRCQFREFAGHRRLLHGEYTLTAASNNSGVYSFCMCPGGLVVPSSSEINHLSVNGMSYHNRGLKNANSAIVTTIEKFDDAKSSIEYGREIERRAFEIGGGDYTAPVIHVKDFINRKEANTRGMVNPSYKMGVRYTKIDDILGELTDDIRLGLLGMNEKMDGFIDDAVLTAVESKTSSPVRIVRDELFMTNYKNLYACGEGAGFAGGIVSAALDGLKCAESIIGEI